MSRKRITLLGSTGSIGQQTLDIVRAHPDRFDVYAMTANSNVKVLLEQIETFRPKVVAVSNDQFYAELKSGVKDLGLACEVLSGPESLCEIVRRDTDIVMAAVVGVAGLPSVLEAVKCGHTIAIANKEPLVAAGDIIMAEAVKSGSIILPVDSEHNAIFQCFDEEQRAEIKRIILTASGGPFRDWDKSRILTASPEEAVNHPNWSMGAKISVDSASMMNKALEVIEARFLFDMTADKIDILVHPQSVVHSMVEYSDGSILAQMGASDMRTPIAYALGYPERISTPGKTLDFSKFSTLQFEPVDQVKFPTVRWAYDCLDAGASHCVAFNAINEVAVAAFLNREIQFGDIFSCIGEGLSSVRSRKINEIDDIIDFDCSVRAETLQWLKNRR